MSLSILVHPSNQTGFRGSQCNSGARTQSKMGGLRHCFAVVGVLVRGVLTRRLAVGVLGSGVAALALGRGTGLPSRIASGRRSLAGGREEDSGDVGREWSSVQ